MRLTRMVTIGGALLGSACLPAAPAPDGDGDPVDDPTPAELCTFPLPDTIPPAPDFEPADPVPGPDCEPAYHPRCEPAGLDGLYDTPGWPPPLPELPEDPADTEGTSVRESWAEPDGWVVDVHAVFDDEGRTLARWVGPRASFHRHSGGSALGSVGLVDDVVDSEARRIDTLSWTRASALFPATWDAPNETLTLRDEHRRLHAEILWIGRDASYRASVLRLDESGDLGWGDVSIFEDGEVWTGADVGTNFAGTDWPGGPLRRLDEGRVEIRYGGAGGPAGTSTCVDGTTRRTATFSGDVGEPPVVQRVVVTESDLVVDDMQGADEDTWTSRATTTRDAAGRPLTEVEYERRLVDGRLMKYGVFEIHRTERTYDPAGRPLTLEEYFDGADAPLGRARWTHPE